MARRNRPEDVFKHVDMRGGDASQCWPWMKSTGGRKDQPRPYFTIDGKKRVAYHVIYELVHGHPIPEGQIIRHTCDNGLCCNPHHHVLGTHEENMKDMRDRERHGLSHYVVRNIRRLGAQGRKHAEIAELYGIARRTVTDIINRKTYVDVGETNAEETEDQPERSTAPEGAAVDGDERE